MITENEIRNQIAIGVTLMEKLSHDMPNNEYYIVKGYLQGLGFTLGERPKRYDKEDI